MTDCRHMGRTRLNVSALCKVDRECILTCLDCGERIPKGHYRKLWESSGLKNRGRTGNTFGFHTDHSGYQVDGGYENCGADQT
jgi:hypothetical protein